MSLIKEHGLKITVFIICLILGIAFAKIYQPQNKTYRIYKQALKDYDNKNYSNAYFQFSKISYSSRLKPYAFYRQAMCAKALGDKQSEVMNYQHLFNYYPKNKLSAEAKYQAAQLLLDDDPNLALKYFSSVQKSDLGEDYQIASKYYIARIIANQVRYLHKKISNKKKKELEQSFRTYLEKVPDGRLAAGVADAWQKFNPKLNSKDMVMVARAYYNAGMYEQASKALEKSKPDDRWAVETLNTFALHDYQKVKTLTETGVEKYSDFVDSDDYNKAVDDYLKLYDPKDKLKSITQLFAKSKGTKKAYIWYLKCENISSTQDKFACHKDLYLNFPNSKYAEKSLMQVFQYGIKNKNYPKCRELAKDFLDRYPNSEYAPYFMFWSGKIEQGYGSTVYKSYYDELLNKYPDTYYAYRAFWITKGLYNATIPAKISYKPVEYPYKYPQKGEDLYDLLAVQDYAIVSKVMSDDFIDSWIEHKKGNYLTSVTIAQKAMDKLSEKPVKSDLRWRLVYPQNYYIQVKTYAQQYNNNDALMMGIIRTESTFNSEAQSPVGAIGLMQLMPATAHEIGSKHGITFNTSYLLNPELNIKLGNLYYSTIRQMLDGMDVSAVAAYNGGIGAVTKWKSKLKYKDTDEFVEQIPYEETKNYVEKVFRSYWNYTRIYQM